MEWRYRHIGHYLAGALAAWVGMDNPILAIGMILSFFGYEIYQGYRKKDMGYWDMLEFTVTLFVVAGILMVLEVTGCIA